MAGEMYQRGMAQREGRAAGFDPYGQRGWSDTKADYDTNWRRWEVNRWYSGDDGSQVGGRFSSRDPSYSAMLSEGVTGPNVRRGGGTSWSASRDFGGGSATNPAKEIGRLQSAMATTSGLLAGAGSAFSQAGALGRRIRQAQKMAGDLDNLPTLPSPTRMNSGNPSNTVRGVRGNTPAGPRPMMQSPTRGGLVNMNNKQDINAVANWTDEQVSSAPGYGGAFLRDMRNKAQQSQLENTIKRGGVPYTAPQRVADQKQLRDEWNKQQQSKKQQAQGVNPSPTMSGALQVPPVPNTNDPQSNKPQSKPPTGGGRFRDKNKRYSTWENAVSNDDISFS